MTGIVDPFDLDAATLRKAGTDLKAFLGALATRLEGALPGRVRVERRSDGLFSSKSHVEKIMVDAEDAVFTIAHAHGSLVTTRAKKVRDVVIGTATLGVDAWLAEVRTYVSALAERGAGASDTLREFL